MGRIFVDSSALIAILNADDRSHKAAHSSSFQIMRRLAIDTRLTFDPHFGDQGFRVVPERS